MNVIEILVLLAFIFFPLIQALLEKFGRGRGTDQLPPEMEGEARTEGAYVDPERRMGQVAAEEEASGGWSSGWGIWPQEELPEELTVEGVLTEEEAEHFTRSRSARKERELPEAVRVAAPVVSMEPLEIDRVAEHRRFHAMIQPRQRAHTPRARPLESDLASRAQVRRAVLLAEVLGPPRALKPLEGSELE